MVGLEIVGTVVSECFREIKKATFSCMINKMSATDRVTISDATEASCRWCLTTSGTQAKIANTCKYHCRIKFELQTTKSVQCPRTRHCRSMTSKRGRYAIKIYNPTISHHQLCSTGNWIPCYPDSKSLLLPRNGNFSKNAQEFRQAHLQGIEGCDLRTMDGWVNP